MSQQQTLLVALGGIGLLLLIGTYLRGQITLLQKLYLPASVIGGFIGLIVLQTYYFLQGGKALASSNVMNFVSLYSMLPALLIMPIVASAPLGIRLGLVDANGVKTSSGYYMRSIFAMFAVFGLIFSCQIIVGLLTGILFGSADGALYPSFGIELMLGFTGGHGLVGLVANPLKEAGSPFWEVSQGIASTTATVGLVFGIVLGIIFINFAVRKHWLVINEKNSEANGKINGENNEEYEEKNEEKNNKEAIAGSEQEYEYNYKQKLQAKQIALKKGYFTDPKLQTSLGKETTDNSSISTFAFHTAIILIVCAISVLITSWAKANQIMILKSFSAWGVSVFVMFIVWGLMNKFNIDHLIDEKVKNQIASFFTEIAVVAAIVSLPIQAVLDYWQPLLVMLILGILVTFVIGRIFSPLAYKDHVISREVSIFGTGMGVFITGLALLKICDPNLKSPVLSHYSVAYAFSSLFGVLVLGGIIHTSIEQGAIAALYHSLILTAFYFICVVGVVVWKHKS